MITTNRQHLEADLIIDRYCIHGTNMRKTTNVTKELAIFVRTYFKCCILSKLLVCVEKYTYTKRVKSLQTAEPTLYLSSSADPAISRFQ